MLPDFPQQYTVLSPIIRFTGSAYCREAVPASASSGSMLVVRILCVSTRHACFRRLAARVQHPRGRG